MINLLQIFYYPLDIIMNEFVQLSKRRSSMDSTISCLFSARIFPKGDTRIPVQLVFDTPMPTDIAVECFGTIVAAIHIISCAPLMIT